MIEEILNSYRISLDRIRALVAELNEDQMVWQADGLPNHPAWTIDHLVYSAQMIGQEMGIAPWLDETWLKPFHAGATPQADTSIYPSKEELLNALDAAAAKLSGKLQTMTGDDLAGPLPDERYRTIFPTLGHAVLHILTVHTSTHAGQLSAWRRAVLNI
jgi:hypothetical protein